jgi:threonine dehydrogenase-like Zn-dependent dehydrogenase
MALLLARVLAAGFVGVDAVDAPRELAARLAAEAAAPAGAEEAVAAASGGLGADIVIDAAGPPAALGAALELVRGRGTLSVVRAHFEPDHPLNNARCSSARSRSVSRSETWYGSRAAHPPDGRQQAGRSPPASATGRADRPRE